MTGGTADPSPSFGSLCGTAAPSALGLGQTRCGSAPRPAGACSALGTPFPPTQPRPCPACGVPPPRAALLDGLSLRTADILRPRRAGAGRARALRPGYRRLPGGGRPVLRPAAPGGLPEGLPGALPGSPGPREAWPRPRCNHGNGGWTAAARLVPRGGP